MSVVFASEQSGQPQAPEPTRPKRPRSSLACIRCRKKKVKCDFVQPTCNRCGMAGLPCSYATPPRRVDGQAFDQLGNHVEELKERMQRMQNELAMMKQNLAPSVRDGQSVSESLSASFPVSDVISPAGVAQIDQPPPGSLLDQHDQSTWKLSLSQSGLRIDTNNASVQELFGILLNGINDLNISNESAINLLGVGSSKDAGNSGQCGRKSWTAVGDKDGSERLWEVTNDETQEYHTGGNLLPKETMNHLIKTCYHRCLLIYEIVDKRAFFHQLANESETESLLLNSINAWLSKHVGIFHQEMVPDQNLYMLGEGYYRNARQILKKHFDTSSPSTIYALLNLYMYQTASDRSDLAYLYIGLAARMAQELKLHKKDTTSSNPQESEQKKRLWWSIHCLDLRSALESNRPTMVDVKECDLDYPVLLDHEDGDASCRISFCVNSIKLLRIRENAIKRLPLEPSGQSLLTAMSEFEHALTEWYSDIPADLRLDYHDAFQSMGPVRDEVCLLLNIQHQTTWIMLHKFFLPKSDQPVTPVALLSLNICTKAANFITRILGFYSSQNYWCHFYWALEGTIVSVAIHQANALLEKREIAVLAQRNLIITANVLKSSPMKYMTKVNQIIENIEAFLKEKGIPTNLDEFPFVDEAAVVQDSLSSVYQLSEIQTSNQHQQPTFVFNTEAMSSVISGDQNVSQHNQQPSLDVAVPLGNLSAQSVYGVRAQTQSPSHSLQTTASPQSTAQALQPPQQQRVTTYGIPDSNNPGMIESNQMFDDSLIGLEMGNNDSAMGQLLIGFDVNRTSQGGNPTAVSSGEYVQRLYGGAMDPSLLPDNPQMHAQGFPAGGNRAMAAAGYTDVYTQPHPPQPASHQQQHQQQAPAGYTSYYNTPEMLSYTPMRPVRSQQQYPMNPHHHQGVVPSQGYNPLFGQIDPSSASAMNTLLPPGQQYNDQLDGGNSQFSTDNAYSSYINGPRKRTRGEWGS